MFWKATMRTDPDSRATLRVVAWRRAFAAIALISVAFASLLACGPTATPVRGPDGERDWYNVECRRSQGECYAEAGEVCPHGYVTADSQGHSGTALVANYNRYGGYAYAVPTYRGNMLIKCHAEKASERDVEPPPDPTAAAKRAYAQCTHAYAAVSDMAETWGDWFGGDASETPPDEKTFLHLCGTLNERTRVCLVSDYAQGHRDDCIATIRALPPATRRALDGLLVAREPEAPPDPAR